MCLCSIILRPFSADYISGFPFCGFGTCFVLRWHALAMYTTCATSDLLMLFSSFLEYKASLWLSSCKTLRHAACGQSIVPNLYWVYGNIPKLIINQHGFCKLLMWLQTWSWSFGWLMPLHLGVPASIENAQAAFFPQLHAKKDKEKATVAGCLLV